MYIAKLIGWEHVGLGSDFGGTTLIIKGLEVRMRSLIWMIAMLTMTRTPGSGQS